MPKYVYKARNIQKKLIEGIEYAGSSQELVANLRKKGLTVIFVKEVLEEAVKEKKKRKAVKKRGRIKAQDIAILCRQLSTMINAGVSVLDAMVDISEMVTTEKFQIILRKIVNDIKSGNSLSSAMKKHPKIFTNVFVSMIKAGEESGKLGKVLYDLSGYLESVEKLKKQVKAASAYPIFVTGFFILTIAGLVLFLVPRFKNMFSAFGAELPFLTKMVMGVSDTAIKNFHWIVLISAGITAAAVMIYRTKKGRYQADKLKLKLPIFGKIMTKVIIAQLFQTLATLIRGGVDVIASLEIASKVVNNLQIEQIISDMRIKIMEGSTLSVEMDKYPFFPRMTVRMTSVGEKTGKMEDLFNRLSEFYNDEVDATVAALSSIIEPVLIVLLGGAVGFFVIAMYLPVFKMATAMMGG